MPEALPLYSEFVAITISPYLPNMRHSFFLLRCS
jgi:hypothetical protein